jgi:hypothetical protein
MRRNKFVFVFHDAGEAMKIVRGEISPLEMLIGRHRQKD